MNRLHINTKFRPGELANEQYILKSKFNNQNTPNTYSHSKIFAPFICEFSQNKNQLTSRTQINNYFKDNKNYNKHFEQILVGPWQNDQQKQQIDNKIKNKKNECIKNTQISFIKRNIMDSSNPLTLRKKKYDQVTKNGQRFINSIIYNYTLTKQVSPTDKTLKKKQESVNSFMLKRKCNQEENFYSSPKLNYLGQTKIFKRKKNNFEYKMKIKQFSKILGDFNKTNKTMSRSYLQSFKSLQI